MIKANAHFSTEKFSQIIRKELEEKIEGAKITTSQVDIMGSTSEAPIQLVLNGENVDELLSYRRYRSGKNENSAGYIEPESFYRK